MPPLDEITPPRRTFPEVAAAAALLPLTSGRAYLPWGAGTMRVAGMVAVCNDIVLGSRQRVVELGSGTSTVLIARLLEQHWPDGGYRHVAVEHDAAWLHWVTDQLAREGLSDRTAVVHAPLRSHDLAVDGLLWYDDDALACGLDACLGEDQINLLVIDGPPTDTADKVLARYPALPMLAQRLSPGATIVLDDIERPGEQEVLRRWTQQLGLRFTAPDLHASTRPAPTATRPAAVHRRRLTAAARLAARFLCAVTFARHTGSVRFTRGDCWPTVHQAPRRSRSCSRGPAAHTRGDPA